MSLASLLLFTALTASGACLELSKDRIEGRDLGIPALRNDLSMVGFTPSPGIVRRIPAARLARLLQRAGVSAEGAEGVCVVRAGRKVTREAVVLALRRAVGDPDVSIELVSFPDISAPDGVIEFSRAALVRQRGAQPDHWRGQFRYGAGRSLPFWADVHLAVDRKVAIAKRDLDAGAHLSAADVRTETIRVHPFTSPQAGLAALAGSVARKRIRAGAVIERDHVCTPFDVNRGDRVRVEVKAGMTVLTLDATAEAGGRAGEKLWVRNAANGRRIQVRITGKGNAVPAS
ncbi:MAG: flagellar basal body P-ring formation chaperone FlgA [Bryobacteraceae bacterium]